MNQKLDRMDKTITDTLKKLAFPVLRYSLATIFIWFGLLKIIGVSPAQQLVANTVYWVDPSWFVPTLGWWELIIGLLFLYKPLIRGAIFLLLPQMLGTFLPLLLLPAVTFTTIPYGLTLEGQYIIKNLILISAAIAVGSHVRDKT